MLRGTAWYIRYILFRRTSPTPHAQSVLTWSGRQKCLPKFLRSWSRGCLRGEFEADDLSVVDEGLEPPTHRGSDRASPRGPRLPLCPMREPIPSLRRTAVVVSY